MARTLLYDPGMVGLPSVLVRTTKARAISQGARVEARTHIARA